MPENSPRPEPEAERIARVRRAVEALSAAELLRLENHARSILMSRSQAQGKSPDDLLQEAISATLSLDRAWNETIPFTVHLYQTMRSIASNWTKRPRIEIPESDLSKSRTETQSTVLDLAATPPDAQHAVEHAEAMSEVRMSLGGDDLLRDVANGAIQGKTNREIARSINQTEDSVRAAKKRIARRVRQIREDVDG